MIYLTMAPGSYFQALAQPASAPIPPQAYGTGEDWAYLSTAVHVSTTLLGGKKFMRVTSLLTLERLRKLNGPDRWY
jgi:hypothetical protein